MLRKPFATSALTAAMFALATLGAEAKPGNVVSTGTGPTPVSACQTIDQPGAYVLTQNLAASGDCLVVNASNVTIDLAGFAITGSNTGSDSGILAGWDTADTVIRNGAIENFHTNVFIMSGIVEDVRIDGGYRGVQMVKHGRASGNVIDNVSVAISIAGVNGGTGRAIVAGNEVAASYHALSCAGQCLIEGNVVKGINGVTGAPAAAGILTGARSLVRDNSVSGFQRGASVGCPSLVVHNAFADNQVDLYLNPGSACANVDNLAPVTQSVN
jgi:hypothetical protein